MKRVIKNPILTFIIGAVLFGTIGVFASNISARQVGYTKNGVDTTLDVALDDLYDLGDIKPVLLWTNPNPTTAFAAQTISLDLSEYKYVVIVSKNSISNDPSPRAVDVFPVLDNYEAGLKIKGPSTSTSRTITISQAGITVTTSTGSPANNFVIPYKIYGIKGELGLDLGISE